MDSHQSVLSPVKKLTVNGESNGKKSDYVIRNPGSAKIEHHRKEAMIEDSEDFIGVLEIFIHQARDIHNICIYHKQDVYGKLCLTSNPETTVATQIINGGGKNPVFNENLQLKVQTIDSSLKCEIWMLSRVKNYLEDQLLGFALVPLSDVLAGNGKLEQEFSLSSSDLFHSPAGFVQLSLSYNGASPEVMAIPSPRPFLASNKDSEIPNSLPGNLDKIEFPDPKIVNENHQMVSEYFGIPCTILDSQSSDSLGTIDTDENLSSDLGVLVVKRFSVDSIKVSKIDTSPSSVSTNGSPSSSIPASSQSFTETPKTSKFSNNDQVSLLKDKGDDDSFAQSTLKVNIEPEQTVVQQEIVDMYMKSMQQFTESLAKMKLPMDIKTESTNLENSNTSSDRKLQTSKNTSSKVFYGSRAFF